MVVIFTVEPIETWGEIVMVLSEVVVFVRGDCVGPVRLTEGVVGVVMASEVLAVEFDVVLSCDCEAEVVFVMWPWGGRVTVLIDVLLGGIEAVFSVKEKNWNLFYYCII